MHIQQFDELAAIAIQLNNESTDLNNTITQINQKLATMNLGIEVWFGPWDEEPFQIGFAKVEDGRSATWELATRFCEPLQKTGDFGNVLWEAKPGSVGTPESLLRASRNIRIDGLAQVPDIIAYLTRAATNKLNTIREARTIATGLPVQK